LDFTEVAAGGLSKVYHPGLMMYKLVRPRVYSTVSLSPELRGILERYADVIERGGGSPQSPESIEVLICGPVAPEELSAMKGLKFIQCVYAGVDSLPWQLIPENVVVASNAGSNSDAVAEHAFALLLTAAKKTAFYDARIRSGRFEVVGESRILRGRRITVLGLGSIGSRIAEIARAFKMTVVGYGRTMRESGAVDMFYTQDKVDEALAGSDYAVVALPLNKYTRGLINYERLNLMKRDGVLVNVGRAPIIVKDDIVRFLKENPSFTFATDVWWNPQNMMEDIDVYSLPNVVSTPWIAGAASSREVYEEMLRLAVINVERYLRGERPLNIVKHEDYR